MALRAILTGLLATTAIFAAPAAADPLDPAPLVRQEDPFSALVGKGRTAAAERAASRFIVASDGRAFVLDDRRDEARIQYLCADGDPRLDCRIDPEGPAPEIFILTKTRGPRGDVIYRDAGGEVRLRLASYGGATAFWPGDASGEAASRSYGEAAPLALPATDYAAAAKRAQSAAAHVSAIVGAPVLFDIGAGAPQDDATVLADAVARTAAGLASVAADATGARVVAARVKSVRFDAGAPSALSLDGARLLVRFDPAAGLLGRPSSGAVARFLEENL